MSSSSLAASAIAFRPQSALHPLLTSESMDIQHSSPIEKNELIVSGRIDGIGAHRLGAALVDSIADGVKNIVVDLKDATFLGSAGLGTLLRHWRQLQKNGGTLHVANPSPQVLLLLNVSGFKDLLLQKS